jgi:AcrR family transcriptional regulator
MYHHVRTKGDLLYTLCTESLSTITEAVGEAIARESDPVAQLRVLITTHLVTSLADQDKHATMLMELRSLPEERREVVTAMRDRYEDMIEEVVGAGQVAGLLRDDVPVRLLTLALLNLLNWTIFWFRPAGGRGVDEIATAFASIYLDGVVVAQPQAGEAH